MPLPEVPDRPEGLAIGTNIVYSYGGEEYYYQILLRDPIYLKKTYSALSPNSTMNYTEVSELDPPSDQIYQIYHIGIDGNVNVYIKQPAATSRLGTDRSPEGGPLKDLEYPPRGQILNIWCVSNNPPSIKIENKTNVTITPRIWFYGWRYLVKRLDKKPDNYVLINIGGIFR